MDYKQPRNMEKSKGADVYGWVLVGACFTVGVLVVDSNGSFGIFLVECVERNLLSEFYVTLIGACRFSLTGLSGVVLGGFAQKYGQRRVMAVGTLLVFLGHAGCALWPELGFVWILFTYGVISSIGFGCYCLVAATAFQEYFKHRLGVANAIVSTGYSCGMFFWPPVLEAFLTTYGWTGGLLMDAALHLHGLPLALLLIPKKSRIARSTNGPALTIEQEEPRSDVMLGKYLQYFQNQRKNSSYSSLPELYLKHNETIGKEIMVKYRSLSHLHSLDVELRLSSQSVGNKRLSKSLVHIEAIKGSLPKNSTGKISPSETHHLCQQDNDTSFIYTSAKCKENPVTASNETGLKKNVNCLNCCSRIKDVVDFTLLKQIPFLMYCLGIAMVQGGGLGPMTLLPARAVGQGISKVQAAFLISISGLCNGILKLLWGFAADIQQLDFYKPLLCGIPAIMSGVTSLVFYVADDYVSFALFSCAWGLLSAGYSSLQYTLVVYLLKGRNISKGAGTLQTLLGVSWTLCLLLSGMLLERSGNAITPFFALGGIQVLGGILIVGIQFMQNTNR